MPDQSEHRPPPHHAEESVITPEEPITSSERGAGKRQPLLSWFTTGSLRLEKSIGSSSWQTEIPSQSTAFPLWNAMEPSFRSDLEDALRSCMSESRAFERHGIVTLSGQHVAIECQGAPWFDADGKLLGAQLTVIDRSPQVSRERQYQSQQAQFKIAQQIAQMGSWAWCPAQDQSAWSEEMGRMFGKQPGYAPKSSEEFAALIHPEDVPGFRKVVQKCVENHERVRYQFRVPVTDQMRHLEFLAQPSVHQATGETVIYGTTRDITAEVIRNEQMEVQRTQIEQSIKELRALNHFLENFAHLASHDLRGPLLNQEVLLKLLRQRLEKGEAFSEILEKSESSVEAMKHNLMAFTSMLDLQQRRSFRFASNDLNHMVQTAWNALDGQYPLREAVLKLDTSAMTSVYYPEHQLFSVVQNFVSNAVKYRHPERPLLLAVSSWLEAGKPMIAFEDNGRGIAQADLDERMFRPEERFHTDVEGNGIGLYLVHALVRAHGGNIHVESTVGKGSRFTVNLSAHVQHSTPSTLVD